VTNRTDSLRHLEREVGVLVRRIRRVIHERARQVHEDLQPASYLLLSWIVDEGPVRASEMVEAFSIDKGAVSRQLQHLDDLGLVERTPDPADGRATLIVASEDARRRLSDIVEHRRKWFDEQLGDWTTEELENFATTLEKYNLSLNG
jgi:DNA-binding MarR family transcriptional regulator